MNLEKLLDQYASLAVCNGANLQKDQLLVISASIECYDFVRKVVKKAYEVGASDVKVQWIDNQINKLRYEFASDEVLASVPQYRIDERKHEQDNKCAYLNIMSPDPMIFKDIDPAKLQITQKAVGEAMKPFRNYTASSIGQWSIILLPNPVWAKLVFPKAATEEEAMDALWKQIFTCTRVEEDNDVAKAWVEHSKRIHTHSEQLTKLAFTSLHFKNGVGTDLTVELPEQHVWAGAAESTPEGVVFLPNIPTEEVFSMPSKYGVNGKVVASKPLNLNGKLVKDFYFEFKDGKVINFGAKENEEVLKNLLEMDEGSKYLGEVALISHDSPISNSGLVFYNTLFDENASCHLALGNCYPMNIVNGVTMTQEELEKKGANFSMIHVDFMFGTNDMSVIGTTKDGKEVTVFADGNFAF